MSDTAYLVVHGRAVVIGKSPDGDSVRFVPDDPARLRRLEHGERIRFSADGSVQLRLDGIDAPELHYAGGGQPLGAAARDALLAELGFGRVAFAPDGQTVVDAVPSTVPITILAQLVEINGRPVALVLTGEAAADLVRSGAERVQLDPETLRRSVNAWEASQGIAYPLLYTSTAPTVRAGFVEAARTARTAARGVWREDSSASFPLTDRRALGPGGALVWPKLFRRASDFLARRSPGETLPEWLAREPLQDDEIHVQQPGADDATSVPLHTLITQRGDRAGLEVDLLDLVVVEREADPAAATPLLPGGPSTAA